METREIAEGCKAVKRVEYNDMGTIVAIEYQTPSDIGPALMPPPMRNEPPPPITVGIVTGTPNIIYIEAPPTWSPPLYGGEGTIAVNMNEVSQ